MRLLFLGFLIVPTVYLASPHASAQTADASAIRYEVESNNRFFLDGESTRYVDDLNLYLRCTARKDGKYNIADKDDRDCADYRGLMLGAKSGSDQIVVPDLRTDAVQGYRVRYDRAALAHPGDYVVDGRRRVFFSLNEEWRKDKGMKVSACHWTFRTLENSVEVYSQRCAPIGRDVVLALSSDGKNLAWQADVTLTLELSSGASVTLETKVIVRDVLIVAMGDSFTSGEGNPERNATSTMPAQWLDNRCNRSVFSYPVMAATALALADPRHSVTSVHVACSGAQTTAGVLEGYEGIVGKWGAYVRFGPWADLASTVRMGTTLQPQMRQVASLMGGQSGRRRPDLLVMSIGVNDVGFADLLLRLAREKCDESHCFPDLRRGETVDCWSKATNEPLKLSFDCLVQRLVALREVIDRELAPQRAFLMEYIDPLKDDKNRFCTEEMLNKRLLDGALDQLPSVLGRIIQRIIRIELTEDEFKFADTEFFLPLKRALAQAAAAPGWAVPPPVEAHERSKRGFCASPSWYHTYMEARARQGTSPGALVESSGTLHPNGFGHFYATIRVLTQLRRPGNELIDHNLSLMDASEFDPKANGIKRPDRSDGFAFYLQARHRPSEPIARYYKF